jgi:hypothetical protein
VPVWGEVVQLAADPGIARAEQPDVGDVLGQHEQPVQAHAEGEPAAAVQSGVGQYVWMGEPAFPDFHPAAVLVHIDLASVERVRMSPGRCKI